MNRATKLSNWARVAVTQQKQMRLIPTPLPSHADVADIYDMKVKVRVNVYVCKLSNFSLKGLS